MTKDVSGNVRQSTAVSGSISTQRGITGLIRQGSDVKELRFLPRESFPDSGATGILYIATDDDSMYYWDGSDYKKLSSSEIADLIDDTVVELDKTWSSSRIDTEFTYDRDTINEIGRIEPMTNSEIQAILDS